MTINGLKGIASTSGNNGKEKGTGVNTKPVVPSIAVSVTWTTAGLIAISNHQTVQFSFSDSKR